MFSQRCSRSTAIRRNSIGYRFLRLFSTCSSFPCKVSLIRMSQVKGSVHPQIASDYEKTFDVLRSLHCNVFLGAHGSYYDMESKYARMTGGANPFIDPKGYENYVNEREQAFRAELARQQ